MYSYPVFFILKGMLRSLGLKISSNIVDVPSIFVRGQKLCHYSVYGSLQILYLQGNAEILD